MSKTDRKTLAFLLATYGIFTAILVMFFTGAEHRVVLHGIMSLFLALPFAEDEIPGWLNSTRQNKVFLLSTRKKSQLEGRFNSLLCCVDCGRELEVESIVVSHKMDRVRQSEREYYCLACWKEKYV